MSQPAAPKFRRVLSRRDLVVYGLVILTPTAPFPVYGIVQQTSYGHAALAYLVAMLAMLFTAFSYGKMAGAFPSAGSTYTYAQRALNPHIGFFAGWSMILDYFLIPLLSVIYAALTAERLLPWVPYPVWAVLFSLAITLVNLRGIRVTTRASTVLLWIMVGCSVLFAFLAIRFVTASHGAPALLDSAGVLRPDTFAVRPLMLGAAIAALSYIGFDAISTLAEDTLRPERDIAVATLLACVIQAAFCVATVYLAALVWPDHAAFAQPETAILDIAARLGGNWMFGIVTFVLLVAGLSSALTGQAGASRLLFGMGRDGVLSRRLFAHLDPRYSTPTRGIWIMGAVTLAGSFFMRFQMAVELLNFGAFTGFILVNLSVIRHYYFRLRRRRGLDFLAHLLSPALGTLVCGYIWISLSANAQLAGFAWLALGAAYLAILTRGFRTAPKALESLKEIA